MKIIGKLFLGLMFAITFSAQAMDEEFKWHPSLRKPTRDKIMEAVNALDLEPRKKIEELSRRQQIHLETLAKRKQNFANKSEEEKAEIRRRDRTAKSKRLEDPEKKKQHAKNSRKSSQKRKLEDPNIQERLNKKARIARAERTEEQIALDQEKGRERRANQTPEQIETQREAVRKSISKRTPEQIEERNEYQRNYDANRTPEQKLKKRETEKAWFQNRSDAQKEKTNKATKERRERRTPEQLEKDKAYHRNYSKMNQAMIIQALEDNFGRVKPEERANEQDLSIDLD